MFKNLKKRSEGFTIIEVLIVLAIAGLIMLIVFLAVPALQRNQRNSTRNTEAGRWAAAVAECLGNRNGVVASCSAAAALNVGVVNELTGFGAATTTGVLLTYNTGCSADGSATVGGASPRSFTIQYGIETTGAAINRCLAG